MELAPGLRRGRLFAADQAPEQEATGRAGDEHVAVERAGVVLGLEHVAPDFVTSAIITDAGRDGDRDLSGLRTRRHDDRGSLRRRRTVAADDRDDPEIGSVAVVDEVRCLDAESGRDTVEPADRYGARPGLEPADGLRSGRRCAGAGDVVQRHSSSPPHLPNPRDHRIPPLFLTKPVFSLSYSFATVAR